MGGSDLILLKGHTDRAVQAHRHVTGATNTYWLNELVRYVKAQGLWDNFRFYPMMPRTNFDTGSTVRGMGGLTANDMTLVNGPTWGASGIAFASASSQYGTIADYLGSETLTCFLRTTASANAGGVLVSQNQPSGDLRSWSLAESYADTDSILISRFADGTASNYEIYDTPSGTFPTSDSCFVGQWVDGGSRSLWLNKSLQTLGLVAGSAQTSRFNTSVDILISAQAPNSPTAFADQTAHALAFLTGTVTTAQRETITDLINLVGSPPPLHALREYVRETGATDTLTLDRLTRYVSDEGLWDNFALYSMMPDTNYDSGSSVKVLGGLTSNDMTLVNGPVWGANGISFDGIDDYGTISDFLGSETLTAWSRMSFSSANSGVPENFLSQIDTNTDDRSMALSYRSDLTGDPFLIVRSSDGSVSVQEAYGTTNEGNTTDDQCIVGQWVDGGGVGIWQNKTALTLSLLFGSAQTSKYNTSVDILLGASNPSSPVFFANFTAHALAFVTGTLTTEQRETITDLINEL